MMGVSMETEKLMSVLNTVKKEYDALYVKLKQKYVGKWDDPVHDSYDELNMQIKALNDQLSSIVSDVQSVLSNIDGKEELIQTSKDLTSEVENA